MEAIFNSIIADMYFSKIIYKSSTIIEIPTWEREGLYKTEIRTFDELQSNEYSQ